MYLKRLELQGFKSFAHKTVLDFEPGMTAVVGPNGSGKSNVADSLRWVMGEQSLKLLRGKKSEDVIFAGSDKKSKLSVAEVALTFDNKDHKIPVEYAEVEIRRRIFRNGESEYLMNNQKVRLLDVVDALMRSGFGATNYAVIGQGTIDQMILAGPAEIKNLVEEAAGVKPYYIKREKTIRRLEQTEENLSRVSELIAEIEPRLRSLKRQAKRMEEREAVANELSGLHLEFFGNQFYLIEQELSAVSENAGWKDKQIRELETEIGSFQRSLEKEEEQSRHANIFTLELRKKVEMFEARKFKLQEELAEVRGKLKGQLVPGQVDTQSLQVQKLDYERQISLIESRLKELTANLHSEQKNFAEIKMNLEKLSAEIAKARDNRSAASGFAEVLERFESEFDQVVNQLTVENLSTLKQRLIDLVSKLKQARSQMRPVDVTALLESKENLNAQLHSLELQIVEHTTLRQNYEENLKDHSAKLNQIKSLLKDDPKDFESELFKREEDLNKEMNSLVMQLEDSRQQLLTLDAEEKKKQNFLSDEEKKYRKKSLELSDLKDGLSKVLIEKARIETRLEALNKEAREALNDKVAQISEFKKPTAAADLVNKIDRLKHQLELAGGIDESTLNEYRETQERFDYLTSQSQDLSKGVVDLRNVIEELDQIIKKQFDEAFEKISGKFVEYFRILFNGGKAQMTLLKANPVAEDGMEEVDEEDAVKEATIDGIRKKKNPEIVGIEIKATPPGKKLATIAALSGGERALTAIAMLCAMLAAYPSPFVVLDEVDAALDEANSIRFAKILSTLAHQTQFITITHNRETMRQAHTLYGVTMSDEGISKILSIKLEQAEKVGSR